MADDSIKIQRLPFPVAAINKIQGVKKRRKEKEENEFNEYIKDTMENEKDKSKPSLNPGEKETVKDDEEMPLIDHKEGGSKINITV